MEHRPVARCAGVSVPPSGVEPDDPDIMPGTLLGPEGTGVMPGLSPDATDDSSVASARRTVFSG